jgi:hypothetical protein
MVLQAIAEANTPILLADTCSLLDLVRDPTRDDQEPNNHRAANDILTACENGQVKCLIARQVELEFHNHDQRIQREAKRQLNVFKKRIERINELSAIYGVAVTSDLTHLDDQIARARAVLDRWLAQITTIHPSADAFEKGYSRMNLGFAPARLGKDSSKDCLVYETYLEIATSLRDAGLTKPIVFLSSNTNDYREGRQLRQEIAAEFQPLNVSYAADMKYAKYLLSQN